MKSGGHIDGQMSQSSVVWCYREVNCEVAGGDENVCRILVGKREGKRPLRWLRRRRKIHQYEV
jgi:hypothetical protein